MYTSRLVLSLAALLLASCGTTGFRVPVLVPAPVNLVQYQTLGVDRFTGDGCQPFSEQLTEALRAARNPLSGEHVTWADVIFVMEQRHLRRLSDRFGGLLNGKPVINLAIRDNYTFMQAELVELLQEKAGPHLGLKRRKR